MTDPWARPQPPQPQPGPPPAPPQKGSALPAKLTKFFSDPLSIILTAVIVVALVLACLLGGEQCDGNCKIEVKVPEGSQTGRTVRLKGRGMPSLRSRERGDLVVELFVETPTRLTARQKELLREFDEIAADNHPQTASFFSKIKGFWDGLGG